jgi:hypothetical protein
VVIGTHDEVHTMMDVDWVGDGWCVHVCHHYSRNHPSPNGEEGMSGMSS